MEQVEFTPTGYAYGGDVFGRDADGKMLFVPFAIPEERVLIEPTRVHDRWAKGRLLQIITPSNLRIPPRCKHYQLCGGCHYQHIPYELQIEVKREILRDQLNRIGHFEDPPIEPTVRSPNPWRYRNNVRFHVREDGKLGFVTTDQNEIFEVTECHLPLPSLQDVWHLLDLPPDVPVREVSLRAGSGEDRLVILHGDGLPDIETVSDTSDSLIWLSDGQTIVLAGDDTVHISVLDRTFEVSAPSFFQTNTSVVESLVEVVLSLLEPTRGDVIFDLYAGVGLFSAFISSYGADVIAIEESPSACSDLETNLRDSDGVTLYESSVELALPAVDIRPDAVVLDPPRAGLSREALDHLASLSPEKIIYVSCDPATLARDGKRLHSHGYTLQGIFPIDMFPQTYHIESVSLWLLG